MPVCLGARNMTASIFSAVAIATHLLSWFIALISLVLFALIFFEKGAKLDLMHSLFFVSHFVCIFVLGRVSESCLSVCLCVLFFDHRMPQPNSARAFSSPLLSLFFFFVACVLFALDVICPALPSQT